MVRRFAFLVVFALLNGSRPLVATPITDDVRTGPAKWKHAITVYIPLDPARNDATNPRTRHNQLKDAVDAWKAGVGPNVPAINVVTLNAAGNDPNTGMPPDPSAEGSVIVQWASGVVGEAQPRYAGEPSGQTDDKGEPILKNQKVISVAIAIDQRVTANQAMDNQTAFVTMLHEFGHALQVDHSKETDSVMQEKIESFIDKMKPGDSDFRELGSLYTAFNGVLDGSFAQLASGLWNYTYTATWLSGGEIPLFQIVTLGVQVLNANIPQGWELKSVPGDDTPNILAFRVAPTDLLQAYLNASFPSITVSFDSLTPPKETTGWLGVDAPITGPLVPEASTFVLVIVPALFLALLRCRKRSSAGSGR